MVSPLIRAATLALRAASNDCPALPACPQNNGCSLSANGVTLQVNCGTDYYGGDLQRSQASTLAGCMKDCSITTGCVAASYVSESCYIKSARNAGLANARVIGIAVTAGQQLPPASSGEQTCPARFTCPENNGCSYTSGSRTLRLSCGIDYYGGDINSQSTESLQACTLACAADTKCVAASFVGSKGAGRCYLKGTRNGASFNENVDAVYVATEAPAPTAFKTCDSINSGANLVTNPSFEQNSGGGNGQRAVGWTPQSNDVYPVQSQAFAHCGTTYIVFLSQAQSAPLSLSQQISTALSTSKSYAITFSFWPYQGKSTDGCSLDIFANDVRVFHRDITAFSSGTSAGPQNYETYVSEAFTPRSPAVTVRVQFKCTTQPSNTIAAILFEDVGLAPV